MVNAIVDYILKSSDERVVINDFVQGDPLSEKNLDRTLELVSNLRKVDSANPCKMGVSDDKNTDKIRLSFPNKSIWIYSGFRWLEIFNDGVYLTKDCAGWKRREIVKKCEVLIDGRYIDSQRNVQAKWRGSNNQNVIDVRKSLKQGKVVLYCE